MAQITQKVFEMMKDSIADGLGKQTQGMTTFSVDASVELYVRAPPVRPLHVCCVSYIKTCLLHSHAEL